MEDVFKCIKEFSIDLLDDDCKYTDKKEKVKIGSRWHKSIDNFRIGEIHLEKWTVRKGNLTGHWIEIPNEWLKEYFEEEK